MADTKNNKKLDIFQALNQFKVSGRMRSVFEKEFKEDKKTETEWKKVFKSKGFDF